MSINGLNSNSTTASNAHTQASSAQDSKAAGATADGASNSKPEAAAESSEAKISTRAQKLQKLAEEFFPSGPGALKITPDFVARLKEYGFISQSQFESMPLNLTTQSSKGDSGTDATSQIAEKMSEVLDKLDESPAAKGLFAVLKEGVEQLKSIEQGGASSDHGSYKVSAQKISLQLKSDEADALSASDQKTIQKMILTLSLADTFAGAKNVNDKINQYLQAYR